MAAAATPYQKREEFQKKRRSFIGGSDLANVTGVDWGCVLKGVLEKRGVEPDFPFHGNQATERGIRLEQIAAEVYGERTGRQIRRAPWRQHPQVEYFGCHSDYEILNHEAGPAPLSIKVPGRESYYRLRHKQQGEISPGYLYQAQWEMFIWNRNWASFGFLCTDPWDMLVFDFQRNEQMISGLVESAHEFWRIKEFGPLPDALPPEDRRCGRCEYRVRCHAQHLQELLDHTEAGTSDMVYDAGLTPLIEDLQERKEVAEEATALVEEAKQRIKDALGGHEAAEGPGFRVYYRPQAGRKTFQREPFLKAHPELAVEVDKFTNKGTPFSQLRIYEVPKRIGE